MSGEPPCGSFLARFLRVARLQKKLPAKIVYSPHRQGYRPDFYYFSNYSGNNHWEIKGRFRKRVVFGESTLVPGFRSEGTCECTLVPVFVPGEHPNVPSFRFSFRGNMQMCPRSGLRYRGTSECTLVPVFVAGEHPQKLCFWKTTLLSTPEINY